MKTNELVNMVNEALKNKGFIKDTTFTYDDCWYKEDKYTVLTKMLGEHTIYRPSGLLIDVTTVYRRNGTEEDKSVDITIRNWDQICGRKVAKVRLNVNMSEKQINNRIEKITSQY